MVVFVATRRFYRPLNSVTARSYEKLPIDEMKLVVLGATGKTGQCVLRQALVAGHEVTAIVRNPEKVTTSNQNLKVVKADIFSESSLEPHFAGQDAVLSCLGSVEGMFSPVTVYSDSIKPIVAAMRGAGVTRFIAVTCWCTAPYDQKDPGPFVIEWILKPLFLKRVIANMYEMETYLLNKCQDINYTIVRPAGLQDGDASDKIILKEEDQWVRASTSSVSMILRADVARCMMSCLETHEWDSKMIAIGY